MAAGASVLRRRRVHHNVHHINTNRERAGVRSAQAGIWYPPLRVMSVVVARALSRSTAMPAILCRATFPQTGPPIPRAKIDGESKETSTKRRVLPQINTSQLSNALGFLP